MGADSAPCKPLPADMAAVVADVQRVFGATTYTVHPASQHGSSADAASGDPGLCAARAGAAEGGQATPTLLDLIESQLPKAQGQGEALGRVIVVKRERYAHGLTRVTIREKDCVLPQLRPGERRAAGAFGLGESSAAQRLDSSLVRSKRLIRQRCLALKVDRLLTLTYRENMDDRERCLADWEKFRALMVRKGLLGDYLAVPEVQKRGAYHVHVAIRGYVPVVTVRRLWHQVVGENNGNVDIAYRTNRGRGIGQSSRLASYLGKYVGKALETAPAGRRCFWASKEWDAPVCDAAVLLGADMGEVISAVRALLAGASDSEVSPCAGGRLWIFLTG